MAKSIVLLRGEIALVDDEDYERLQEYKWIKSYYGYVVTNYSIYSDGTTSKTHRKKKGIRGRSVSIRMHREILGVSVEQEIDHKDGNPLNNQKENLRICNSAQNKRNQKKRCNCKCKYKGVKVDNRNKINKWISSITVNYNTIYLGSFSNEEQAAKAHDKSAIKYFGKFARLNFPKLVV